MLSGPHKTALSPGARFGRYSIVRRVGAGGMGVVYEAAHLELKRRVAIKVLLPELINDDDARARFLREGEAVARVRHPNVVDIHDLGFEGGAAFMVMEYLEGVDLAEVIKASALSPERIAEIMLPVCAGVEAAHTKGVIHRDLKPANIILAKMDERAEVPKVLDFGVSKIIGEERIRELTASGAIVGTPFFIAPEQAKSASNVDPRSDQYSLGVILYQCATRQVPFRGGSTYQVITKIVAGDFEPPRKINPNLPTELEATILRAMATEAHQRFASVAELALALLPWATKRTRAFYEGVFEAQTDAPTVLDLSGRATERHHPATSKLAVTVAGDEPVVREEPQTAPSLEPLVTEPGRQLVAPPPPAPGLPPAPVLQPAPVLPPAPAAPAAAPQRSTVAATMFGLAVVILILSLVWLSIAQEPVAEVMPLEPNTDHEASNDARR